MERPPLTDEDGEVRELTADDFKKLRPLAEVDPGLIEAMKAMRNTGGRPRAETRDQTVTPCVSSSNGAGSSG